jgi:hypothetical protein
MGRKVDPSMSASKQKRKSPPRAASSSSVSSGSQKKRKKKKSRAIAWTLTSDVLLVSDPSYTKGDVVHGCR